MVGTSHRTDRTGKEKAGRKRRPILLSRVCFGRGAPLDEIRPNIEN